MARVFVPADAAALALGAEAVARAFAQQGVAVVRTGARGLFWLEPLVEVETRAGRIGYGPVHAEDVPGMLAAGLLAGGGHPLCLGPMAELPFLRPQKRIAFARVGVIDPFDFAAWRAHGGLAGLARALSLGPEAVIAEIERSGLRGRGGAGFPTATKWRSAAAAPGAEKYVVCNADEGDSGSYADRMLMEGDPFAVIEGMVIAGLAIGAHAGILYCRSEYPHAARAMAKALALARENGLLGADVLGAGLAFDIELRLGAGAYVCGEETALLESVEGRRGMVRAKPPLPVTRGLFGCPTVVNNLLTLASVPPILAEGAEGFAALGIGRSRGTLPVQLGGNVRRPGVVEVPFGIRLGALVEEFGGGTASGRPLRAIQVGGPLGAFFPPALLDTPLAYEAIAAEGGVLGHGGIVVFDDSVSMAEQARLAMAFCAEESCGKCTPCRLGAVRAGELLDQLCAGQGGEREAALLEDLCQTMRAASLCALGGLAPNPVQSALCHFSADFHLSRRETA